jgi:hypothetical protein
MTDKTELHDLGWPLGDRTHPDDPQMTTDGPPDCRDGLVVTREEFREFCQLWFTTELQQVEWLTDDQALVLIEMLDEALFASYSDGDGGELEA